MHLLAFQNTTADMLSQQKLPLGEQRSEPGGSDDTGDFQQSSCLFPTHPPLCLNTSQNRTMQHRVAGSSLLAWETTVSSDVLFSQQSAWPLLLRQDLLPQLDGCI